MNDIQILVIIILCGVFGIGFLGLGIYMFFDKTPSGKTTNKPPIWLNKNNKYDTGE